MQSAALGLAIAGALGLGYSNIFVTAPSPENLRTLFEFIFKGLDQLDYKEHLDYDLVESTNPAFAKAIVRVNVFKNHRQVRGCYWDRPPPPPPHPKIPSHLTGGRLLSGLDLFGNESALQWMSVHQGLVMVARLAIGMGICLLV